MYPTDLSRRLAERLDPDPQPRPDHGDRLAAVLVPVIDGRSLVFTKRSETLSRHAGEISFPGGLRHDDDPTVADVALRETEEELGVDRSRVELLGALPPVHTFVSGILVVPFVGVLAERPVFRPNPQEIAEVLEYPIGNLAAAEADVRWSRDGREYMGYAYDMGEHTIWGATARILHGFLEAARGASS
jgi:8-oxo-dGTP pyrophosphatase MutT (NUDIX family)